MGEFGYAFGGGFLFGYSTYLAAHYAIHMYKPPKNFLSVIWKHHNLHHFVGDDGAFGVSQVRVQGGQVLGVAAGQMIGGSVTAVSPVSANFAGVPPPGGDIDLSAYVVWYE